MTEVFIKIMIPVLSAIGGVLFKIEWDKRRRKATTDTQVAIAKQETIKAEREELALSKDVIELYKELYSGVLSRLNKLEADQKELENKYNEVQLRNSILEERADTREKQYQKLEKEHKELKENNKILLEENKKLSKEIHDFREENKEIKAENQKILKELEHLKTSS